MVPRCGWDPAISKVFRMGGSLAVRLQSKLHSERHFMPSGDVTTRTMQVFLANNRNQTKAAEELGITRDSLRFRLRNSMIVTYRKPPKKRSDGRRRYSSHEDRRIGEKNNRRRLLYKMEEADYERLLASQGFRCAICGDHPKNKDLPIDHCHQTGKVRGLLCTGCNTALGKLGDNEAGLRRALQYITGASA